MKLFAIAVLSFASSFAFSHPLDMALLQIDGSDPASLSASLKIHPNVAAKLLKMEPMAMEKKLHELKQKIYEASLGSARVSIGGEPCAWAGKQTVTEDNQQTMTITDDFKCPSTHGKLSMTVPFLSGLDNTYRLTFLARINGLEHIGGASVADPKIELEIETASLTFSHFVKMGMEHVGMMPNQWRNEKGFHIAYGIDHILFVLALLFSGLTVLNLLKTITGFTIGHTLSLALASFGIVQFSGRWIEAAIALTIAYVAFETVVRKHVEHRWKVAVGIGMIHGLGFAAALANLQLDTAGLVKSILGFNLGVEIGQALIVAIFIFPLISLKRHAPRAYLVTIKCVSLVIFFLASYWFVQRAFLS